MRTQARALGLRLRDFGILPMVKYTGYAALLPTKLVSLVLSDAIITGATVPPGGMASWNKYQVKSPVGKMYGHTCTAFHSPPVHISEYIR